MKAVCTGCGFAVGAKPFERDDFFSHRRGDRQQAGAHRAIIDQHGAGAALAETAAEAGIIQGQIVAKDVEQRAIGVHIDGVGLAIHFERYVVHENLEAQI